MKRYFQIATVASFMLGRAILPTSRSINAPMHRAISTVGAGKPDLAKLTVKELRALATKTKIKGRSKARRKADLVKLIKKAGVL